MSPPAPDATPRHNAFDFLRLVAALAVVVQHGTVHLGATFLWVDPHDAWWFYDGVPAFFVLSGYFVYRSLLSLQRRGTPTGTYVYNRLLRVAPAIWTYLVITLVLLLILGAVTARDLMNRQGLLWIASTVMLAPVYSPPALDDVGIGTINGSLWTIPVEVSFYIILPLSLLIARHLGRRTSSALAIGTMTGGLGLAVLLHDTTLGNLTELTFLPHLGFFALGIAWFHVLPKWQPTGWQAALGLVAYACCAALRGTLPDAWYLPATLLATVPLSVLLMWAGVRGPAWARRLTARLGDLSFGTYIWHMPIINLMLWIGVRDHMDGTPVVALAIALTVAAAWMSWRCVERPALGLKRSSSRGDAIGLPQATGGNASS